MVDRGSRRSFGGLYGPPVKAGNRPGKTRPGENGWYGPVVRGLNRNNRLRRSEDFKRVRRQGKSYAHPLVVLMACASELDQTRIGIAAGKRVGGAVQRNRAKRLLRAALQPLLPRLAPGWDLIFLARQPLSGAAFPEVEQAVQTLLNRARLVVQETYVQ